MELSLNFCSRFAMIAITVGAIFTGVTHAQAADYTAKIGHLESAQQSRHVNLEKVAALVNERTGGAVEFQLFPQSQLGNQRQMTEGVQLGTLEGTVAPAAFLGGFNPLVSIMDIPFLLPADRAAAQKLREGTFGQTLLDSFSSKGVVAVTLWPNGRKNFTSNKPLDNIAAFKGQKFRTMDSKILIEQFNALGASAIALPFGELYTSLQTGVVDGEENPLDTIQRMKFYEVQKYLVVSEHGAMEDVILFNQHWWNNLPEEFQKVIKNAFIEAIPELQQHKTNAVKEALDVIAASGINVRTSTDAEKDEFRKKMYKPTVAAYIKLAGEAGKTLIEVYEKSYAEVVGQ